MQTARMGPPDQSNSIQVFVAASELDMSLAEQLVSQLTPFEKQGWLQVLSRRSVPPGVHAAREVESYIRTAKVAILLLSKNFLNDDEIDRQQLPLILERESLGTLRVVPVLAGPCLWESHPELRSRQIFPSSRQPLSSLTNPRRQEEILEIVRALIPGRWMGSPKSLFRDMATFQQFLKEAAKLRVSISKLQQWVDASGTVAEPAAAFLLNRGKKEMGRKIAKVVLKSVNSITDFRHARQSQKLLKGFMGAVRGIALYDKIRLRHITSEQLQALLGESFKHDGALAQLDSTVETLRSIEDCEVSWEGTRTS